MAARWGYFEDSVRLAAALRPALAARGVPEAIYVDNGSAFVDAALKRAAARLGIKITHSAPGRPQGRGKIERFFGIVRQEFLVEVGDGSSVTDLTQLNRLFTAWYETVYHARPHGETGQPPIERWLAGAPFPTPSPEQLREAFLWSELRTVAKTATIKLFGGVYQTDPALACCGVECVFDPFDLTHVEVRCKGRPYGQAIPYHVSRHPHPKAKPKTAGRAAPATGIDYLRIIAADHGRPPLAGASATTLCAAGTTTRRRSRGVSRQSRPGPGDISDLMARRRAAVPDRAGPPAPPLPPPSTWPPRLTCWTASPPDGRRRRLGQPRDHRARHARVSGPRRRGRGRSAPGRRRSSPPRKDRS